MFSCFHTFHRYISNCFAFVGRGKSMAYSVERVMHYGSGNLALHIRLSVGNISYKTFDLFSGNENETGNNGLIAKQYPVPDDTRGQLNRTAFENYLSQQKPFLDPDFKLTDMAEAMGEPYHHV